MDLVQFTIIPINNAKHGNKILKDFQLAHPEYYDFSISISENNEFGYFMTIIYKTKGN